MKPIMAYEFQDLDKNIQEKVMERFISEEVDLQLTFLQNDLLNGNINENEFWKEVGCSKFYGESTPWFIPSVYYEKHKEDVDKEVKRRCETSLFTAWGIKII